MNNGHGVFIKNFGAFTFEVASNTVKPAQMCSYNTSKNIYENREDRKHIHNIRPCFLVDGKFKNSLQRFPNKSEIDCPASQHSVFQQGINMCYCNPVPISRACYLSETVTKSLLNATVMAISD